MSNQHRASAEQWAALRLAKLRALELRARVEALEAAANNRQHGEAADSADVLSLVVRVANAIYESTSLDLENEGRAAIREVAAWIDDQDGPLVELAIARRLRDEADR